MDMVGGSAQSAVDSLLGRLSSVLVEEAQLLGNVHSDMKFIKREMESMNGFVLDAADDGRGGDNNQVRAWRRQVHELAFDCQSCVDRYVHTFGARHPAAGAGLLASFGRVPELVRTLPTRHRIATEIRELKDRVLEVGERRLRYGVVVTPAPKVVEGGGSSTLVSHRRSATAIASQEADDARRRSALDSVRTLFDDDERAKELVAWLMGADPVVPRGRLRRNQLATAGEKIKKLVTGSGGLNDVSDLIFEVVKLIKGISEKDNPENMVEGARYLMEALQEVDIQEVKGMWTWLKDKTLGSADNKPQETNKGAREAPAPAANENLLEAVKNAKGPMEMARAEARYIVDGFLWLCKVLYLSRKNDKQYPKVVAIVTPPVEDVSGDDGPAELLLEDTHATELARKVYDHPRASNCFRTKVWVDAKQHSNLKQMLLSILHQVLQQQQQHTDSESGATPGAGSSSSSSSSDRKDMKPTTEWKEEELKTKIADCLKDKKFLIVLADAEDNNSWQNITSALPGHRDSAVIITPRIKYMAQFHGWYMASWIFAVTGASSRYRVHFCSNLVAIGKVAAQLVSSSDNQQLPPSISAVLKKCLWDSFATKMFLHALYANPHRSDGELERLMLGLKYASSVSNARHMVQFCFEDLPRQYQSCLLSLTIIFPPRQQQEEEGNANGERMKLKRTSLVRRWAAESFVSARDGLAAVDEAHRCFDALVARGLLDPVDVGTAGKVKTCTLDPRVLSFITKMASSDAIIITDNRDDLPPNMARHLSTTSSVILQRLMEDQSVSYSNTCWGMMRSRRSRRRRGRHVSTTPPAAGEGDSASSREDDGSVVTFLTSLPASSDQLGLVKLLDLEGCKGLTKRRLKNICNKIFQLKYLSLRNTDSADLPKEINRLRYLETLDIRETAIQSFPADTISLPKLMHLLAGTGTVSTAVPAPGEERSSSSSQGSRSSKKQPFSTVHLPTGIGSMTNMQVLSHVEVSKDDEDEFRNVGRKLHLRKLGVVVCGEQPLILLLRVVGMLHESLCKLSVHLQPEVQSEGGAPAGSAVAGNDFTINNATEIPKSLESLNINGKVNKMPDWVTQLHRLSKITLCRTSLKEEHLHMLGELANLRCIRLLHQSYDQQKFTFNTREFRKLELLVIEDSGISDVHFAASGSCISLQRIDWTFTRKDITLSGIKKLLNIKEIHLNGHCDNMDQIIQDANENANPPKIYFNQ